MDVLRKYFLMVVAGLLILLSLVKDNYVIDQASAYTTEIAKDSGAVYLSLRAINAALSFAEEIEVNASVVIASGSIHPFKVLEPIDDAVERMSSAVFHIGVIAASLTVVLEVFGRVGLFLFGVALGVQQVSVRLGWIEKNSAANRMLDGVRNSSGVVLIALIAFFASAKLSDDMSDAKWAEFKKLLTEVSEDVGKIAVIDPVRLDDIAAEEVMPPSNPDQGEVDDKGRFKKWVVDPAKRAKDRVWDKGTEMIDGVRGATSSAMASMVEKYDVAKEITSKLWERKDELIEAFTGVFALFLFKTFMLPLMIFLFLYGSLKGTFRHRP